MDMIVNVGMALQVDAESVEEAETKAELYLRGVLADQGALDPLAIAMWSAADYDKATREATFHARDLRAQTEPEYGLLPGGRKLMEENLQKIAEQQAQMAADAQAAQAATKATQN